jgi:hypothetical protein
MFSVKNDFIVLSFVSVVLILQTMAIVLQLNGGQIVHWAVAFIPLWLLEFILLYYIASLLIKKGLRHATVVRWDFVVMLIVLFIGSLVFLILLSIQLTHPLRFKAISLYSPILTILIIYALYPVVMTISSNYEKQYTRLGESVIIQQQQTL